MKPTLWGIDLGGTKIEGVILESPESTAQKIRIRIPTEAERGYDHIVAQVARLVKQMSAESGETPVKIGIGTPGSIDPSSGLLKNSNTVCLNYKPLRDDLEKAIGVEVRMANDANCFALAEATLGSAKGYDSVFGIILGTGVGGGIVVGGRALQGRHGIAGEWGHNEIEPGGLQCYCGKRGCVETVISGPALESYYKRLSGAHLSLREIVDCAGSGNDENATATIARLTHYFAKGLASILNVLDPDAVVIGGGVGNIATLYSEKVRREIEHHLFNPTFDTPILRPSLGDSAGVFGAAGMLRKLFIRQAHDPAKRENYVPPCAYAST